MLQLNRRIRELRKKKHLTQEQLAAVLNISPKTVSKWECGESTPDLAVIPDLAEFFEVNLDTLFGYEPDSKKRKLEELFAQTRKVFWSDYDRCREILVNAMQEFPNSEEIRHTLLNLYECHMRCFGRSDCIDDGIVLARELIETADDFLTVCDAKDDLASFLLQKGRYEEAKEVLFTLPDREEWSYHSRAFRLRGRDRLDAALPLRKSRIQDLYCACNLVGLGYWELGQDEQALSHFCEAVKVIEMFMRNKDICFDAYLWSGMQTHHWSNYLGMAACLYRMGRKDEAEAAVDRAYDILSHGWDDDFEADRESFMEPYRKEFIKFGIDKFKSCP